MGVEFAFWRERHTNGAEKFSLFLYFLTFLNFLPQLSRG